MQESDVINKRICTDKIAETDRVKSIHALNGK